MMGFTLAATMAGMSVAGLTPPRVPAQPMPIALGFAPYKFTVSGSGSQLDIFTLKSEYTSGNAVVPCTKVRTTTYEWSLKNVGVHPGSPTYEGVAATRFYGAVGNPFVLVISPGSPSETKLSVTVTESGTCPASASSAGCGTYTFGAPTFQLFFDSPPSQLTGLGTVSGGSGSCKYADLESLNGEYVSGLANRTSELRKYCNADLTSCSFPVTMTLRGSKARSYCQGALLQENCSPPELTSGGAATWKDTSDSWRLSINDCKDNPYGANGWEGLSGDFQQRLQQMYEFLDREGACYHFTVGYRTYLEQQRLWTEWHDITDENYSKNETPDQVCTALRAAGLAQLPKGLHGSIKNCVTVTGAIQYASNGTAKGGSGDSRRLAAQLRGRSGHHRCLPTGLLDEPADVPTSRALGGTLWSSSHGPCTRGDGLHQR